MAAIMEKTAEEKIKIIRPGEKKEKHMAKLLLQEGLVLEDFFVLEKVIYNKIKQRTSRVSTDK